MHRLRLLASTLVAAASLAALADDAPAADPTEQTVTVLFNEKTVEIDHALVDGDQLWVGAADVPKVNGFEPKPQGFCSAEVCIPIPKSSDWRTQHGGEEYFNVTRFAARVGQAVALEPSQSTFSFGMVPLGASNLLPSGVAPDFELPDRQGNLVKLSDFRGKKVLLLTWASW